jgi:eukaryotic-like serine/threonine-protein kinase
MVGQTVSHYRVLRQIGGGGMGTVYEAADLRLRRHVALKFIAAGRSHDSSAVHRFEREALAASALNHPHICTVHDVGEHEGEPFLVMELLEGQTLGHALASGPVAIPTLLSLAVQVTGALEAAHRAGIIHRDITPANVLITVRGDAKILDFGLAKLRENGGGLSADSGGSTLSAFDDLLTGAGAVMGTAAYMSPEQVRGEEVDHRTDFFSLGAVLYEMATGRRAFAGKTRALVFDAILHDAPVAAAQLNPLVPEGLAQIIDKALEKNRALRYQDAADIKADLERLRRDLGRTSEASGQPASGGAVGRGAGGGARRRLFRNGLAAGILAAATLMTVGGYRAWVAWSDVMVVTSSRQVTSGPHPEFEPAVSPDGTLIAYTSNQSGNDDIWLAQSKAGTTATSRWTTHQADDSSPAWFPDGATLAFQSNRDGRTAIWTAPMLNGDAAQLLLPDAGRPAISADGKWIAFVRRGTDGGLRIGVAPVDDPPRARFLTTAEDGAGDHDRPAWSPDGQKICYSTDAGLRLISTRAGGGRAWSLTAASQADIEPRWSSDGRYIFFSSVRDGRFALWRVPAAGGQPRRVTSGMETERSASVSRDGRTLAFSKADIDRHLCLLELATGKETPLAETTREETYPVFGPDSRTVYFVSEIWGNMDIWRRDLPIDGRPAGPLVRVGDRTGVVSHLACSPNGRWLAYHRVRGESRVILTIPTSGGRPTPVTDDRVRAFHPAWSPDGEWLAFVAETNGVTQVWCQRVAEGRAVGAARQLTVGPETKRWPSWPDNGRVAYAITLASGTTELGVVGVDGKSPQEVVTEGADIMRVRWRGTPPRLYAVGRWGKAEYELRVLELKGRSFQSTRPPIPLGAHWAAGLYDISPDERYLIGSRGPEVGNIYVLEAESRRF